MATLSKENILHFHGRSFSLRHERVHYTQEPGYHVHPEMELAILANGGGKRIVNGAEEDFNGLDVVFTPGDIPHCWKFSENLCPSDGVIEDSCCQFSSALLSGLSRLYPEFAPMSGFFTSLRQAIQITGATAKRIESIFNALWTQSEMRQVMALLEIFILIYEMREFRTVGMSLSPDVKANKERGRLHLIDRFISENYRRKIAIDEVASALGMSTTAFCNVFKQMTGTTFYRYLTDYRMRLASNLLSSTNLNIGEIGYRTGYSDVAHFTHAFTAHYKVPPSVYRNKQKQPSLTYRQNNQHEHN